MELFFDDASSCIPLICCGVPLISLVGPDTGELPVALPWPPVVGDTLLVTGEPSAVLPWPPVVGNTLLLGTGDGFFVVGGVSVLSLGIGFLCPEGESLLLPPLACCWATGEEEGELGGGGGWPCLGEARGGG